MSPTPRQLTHAQLKIWVSEGKAADDVFKLLTLNLVKDDDLLRSPMLTTWTSYVNKLGKNPDQALVTILKARYNNDGALASMFASAKEVHSIRVLCSTAGSSAAQDLGRGRKTADDVFKLLKLDQVEGNLLNNPMFDHLELIPENIGKKSGRGVAWRVAEDLEMFEIKHWINEGKTVNTVFKMLKLDEAGDKLFENSALPTLVSYMKQLGKSNVDLLLFSVLKAHYGDDALERIIAAGMGKTSTNVLVEGLQGEVWLSKKMTAEDVFELLKLDKEKKNVLESPANGMWASYLTKLNKNNPNDFTGISVLKKVLGSDLKLAKALHAIKNQGFTTVKPIQKLQFKEWTGRRITPPAIEELYRKEYDPAKDVGVILDFFDYQKKLRTN
ncbi:unnamed protein product [Phytophthora lilii]|uniref:Unnamed protein product n=1 Tax=Phytophthora lilii TaxID=2077276 RepID=A0A9W6X5U3_9STRA|nr:unnamed protein product [Phytophthora lilii]